VETRSHRPKRSVLHAERMLQQPRRPVSLHHRSRAQRERRLQLLAIAGAGLVVLVVALILGYGYWRNVIRLGDTTLVTVDGRNYSAEFYARYLGTRQAILTRQIQQAQSQVQPTPTTTAPDVNRLAAQQTLQQLQSEQAGLSTTALTDFVEGQLVIDEAKSRNLTASQAELDDALRWLMSPPEAMQTPPTGLEAAPATLPVTGTITLDQAKQALNDLIGKGRFFDQSQVTDYILRPMVLKTKLESALAGNIPKTEEMVHARHILVATEAEATDIRNQLEHGADFATLAKAKSTDTGTKDKGGDLGWFPRGVMVPEFDQAAFSLKVGEISQPIKSQYGYHIIQVLAKDPNHPLDAQQIQQAREQAYQSWFGKAQGDQTKVTYHFSQPLLTWVQNYVSQGN
jgi:parvulin-like peptidyl-prolyl isomerase